MSFGRTGINGRFFVSKPLLCHDEKMKSFSPPKIFLILENLIIFVATLLGYHLIQGKRWLFLLLLLSPEIFMLGYLFNPKIGCDFLKYISHDFECEFRKDLIILP